MYVSACARMGLCVCRGLGVLVCVTLQANCLSKTSSGPCPLLGSGLHLSGSFARSKMQSTDIICSETEYIC